jgi:hypothetical protein
LKTCLLKKKRETAFLKCAESESRSESAENVFEKNARPENEEGK